MTTFNNMFDFILKAKESLKGYFEYVERDEFFEKYPDGHYVHFDFDNKVPSRYGNFDIIEIDKIKEELALKEYYFLNYCRRTILIYVPDNCDFDKLEIAQEFKAQLITSLITQVNEDFCITNTW